MRRNALPLVLGAVVGAVVATPIAVYAAHSFNDVSESNTFHADIEWLKDSDVTRGCNPPANTEFCPDDFVTREQMAAFMRRLAQYLGAEDGTPAQADNATTASNAEMLDGNTVAQLVPRAAFNATDDAPDGQFTLATEITAPAPGVLIASGTVTGFAFVGDADYSCQLVRNGEVLPGTTMNADAQSPDDELEICGTTGAIAVDAGTHAIRFQVFDVSSGLFEEASVWALWVPFDGTGAVPTKLGDLGLSDDDGLGD